MTDQSTWPAHLRDDAPSQQCGRCGRTTWSPSEFGTECRMPQPDGFPCGGRFEPPAPVLNLYAARYGTPVPDHLDNPLHEAYVHIGRGRPRLAEPSFYTIPDILVRSVAGIPQLLIRWEEQPFLSPDGPLAAHGPVVHMCTIIGEGPGANGAPVRFIAHRVGRLEHDLNASTPTTAADLHPVEPTGHAVTWQYAERPLPAVVNKWYFADVNGTWEVP